MITCEMPMWFPVAVCTVAGVLTLGAGFVAMWCVYRLIAYFTS